MSGPVAGSPAGGGLVVVSALGFSMLGLRLGAGLTFPSVGWCRFRGFVLSSWSCGPPARFLTSLAGFLVLAAVAGSWGSSLVTPCGSSFGGPRVGGPVSFWSLALGLYSASGMGHCDVALQEVPPSLQSPLWCLFLDSSLAGWEVRLLALGVYWWRCALRGWHSFLSWFLVGSCWSSCGSWMVPGRLGGGGVSALLCPLVPLTAGTASACCSGGESVSLLL